MKLRLAQINSTVGAFEDNSQKIRKILTETPADIDLVVFPECVICGYPPQDLLEYPDFARRALQAIEGLAKDFPSRSFLLGSIEKNEEGGKPLRNVAYFVSQGRIQKKYYKRLLPSYDVFDEDRFFEAGREALVLELNGLKISVTICEDIWGESLGGTLHNRYAQNPLKESEGADLLINISASPFEFKKVAKKEAMLRDLAQRHRVPLVYLNAVGANDGIVFDGRSYLINSKGEILRMGRRFSEELIDLDLERDLRESPIQVATSEIEDIYEALRLGIVDYCRKLNFDSVILGMSGGIDSAVVACLAADALGAENVVGVLMPSRYTAAQSNQDALSLARVMQNPIHLIPIEPMFGMGMMSLEKAFEGTESGVAEENLQSRIRGTLLMGLSNKFGHLLLTTGNKSELAVGYCTLYGDMNGGLAPLADVYKHQVYALGREANKRWNRIPESCFVKAPSAELRPNQKDQDTLPDYDRLDRMLEMLIEGFETRENILKAGFSASEVDKVLKWVAQSEFKRFQMPIGLKVSSKAFGIGRRFPIVHRFF